MQVVSVRITRRNLLASALAVSAAAEPAVKSETPRQKSPIKTGIGEFVRLTDPITETPLVRLTSSSSNSVLPDPTNRFVSLKGRFLLFSSDRTGHFNPFRADLRTGAVAQVADTQALRTDSLCLDEQDRWVRFVEGDRLVEMNLLGHRTRVIADGISAFSEVREPSEFVVVRRKRLEYLSRNGPVLAEDVGEWCLVSPDRARCLFGRELAPDEKEIWCVGLEPNGTAKPVRLASGNIANPRWSSDGRAVLFLRNSLAGSSLLSEIRQVSVGSREETEVAKTSQFAAFNVNEDGSVFLGASRSKAQPNILLLLRSAGRELTLCEHRAHDPRTVKPTFSPDNRRLYFQSDREGKFAIYSMNLEAIVEPNSRSN
jgi:oligogalacturonide lyase